MALMRIIGGLKGNKMAESQVVKRYREGAYEELMEDSDKLHHFLRWRLIDLAHARSHNTASIRAIELLLTGFGGVDSVVTEVDQGVLRSLAHEFLKDGDG